MGILALKAKASSEKLFKDLQACLPSPPSPLIRRGDAKPTDSGQATYLSQNGSVDRKSSTSALDGENRNESGGNECGEHFLNRGSERSEGGEKEDGRDAFEDSKARREEGAEGGWRRRGAPVRFIKPAIFQLSTEQVLGRGFPVTRTWLARCVPRVLCLASR